MVVKFVRELPLKCLFILVGLGRERMIRALFIQRHLQSLYILRHVNFFRNGTR